MTTITHSPDTAHPANDAASEMLREAIAEVQPGTVDELLALASLVTDVDAGLITAQTVLVAEVSR
ncbi:hypothetical protein [Gordonia sputi]